QPWILAEPAGGQLPAQGWKLHVSSYEATAAQTLQRALAPLIAANVAFKVVGSADWLRGMNLGAAGLSQVGKFITAYPADDAAAVRVAVALGDATRGLRGPRIPSDRPVEDDGVVHYRYGAFGSAEMQTLLGEILPALVDPDGCLEPDRRGSSPRTPSWVSDPFAAAGLGGASRLHAPVAGRYHPAAVLRQSPGVVVQLGIDVKTPQACILKRARASGQGGLDDNAAARVRREAGFLAQVSELGFTPRLMDVVDTEDEVVVVTEDLGGESLERHVAALATRGRSLPRARIVALGVALAEALGAFHGCGFIHGDVKSANIIVAPDGRPRLIDLDLAAAIGSGGRAAGAGTRGYTSPGCRAGLPVAVADDIYALGAVLYFLVTGAEPSRAPNPGDLLERSPALLAPQVGASLVTVVERCLSPQDGWRFATAAHVGEALQACESEARRAGAPAAPHVMPQAALRQVRKAAGYICAQAESSGDGLVWRSTYFVGKGLVGRDVNSGMAGTVLTLAELVDELGGESHADVLRRAATTLHGLPRLPGGTPAGLCVGDAGVAAAILRAGQVLADPDLIAAAAARGRAGAERSAGSPDFFHGAAGRLLVHLLLWDETRDPARLDAAVALGEGLLEAREGGPGEACWRIPAGYGDLSGRCYLGYAHGAAGIADVLLDLFEATGDVRFRATAADAMSWLARQGVPVLDDDSGLGWPTLEGGAPHPPFWCHGATGIARLFLHAERLEAFAGAGEIVRRAARSVAEGVRWSGPTICHGLAGNAELLLDVATWTGERGFADDARRLMALVDAYAV
ncbi:MAG TPA: lanthionine synthetase LanC family protein, partial [Solirubrobacteraceae bacterium]|nr:lanthionine synthetase LanC family protein [Solirubrobacteraceae bacterium]